MYTQKFQLDVVIWEGDLGSSEIWSRAARSQSKYAIHSAKHYT